MQQSIKDILAKTVNDKPLSHDELTDRLYRGIIHERARYDTICAHLDQALDNPSAPVLNENLIQFSKALKSKIATFCGDDRYTSVLQKAFQMSEEHLDIALRKVVENFMEEKILTRGSVLTNWDNYTNRDGSPLPPPDTPDLPISREYITTHYRMQAGQIFGLINSDEERAQLDLQLVRILLQELREQNAQYHKNNNAPEGGFRNE